MTTKPDPQQSQQEFLQEAKATLNMTWDEFAAASGIAPRALKNYRLPDDSQNHRTMPNLAWQAVRQLLVSHAKTNRKKAA